VQDRAPLEQRGIEAKLAGHHGGDVCGLDQVA